ncbi:MAG TPA: DNA polymerase III subunit gamma/tau [Vicinamibacterales bacterium]|nr:DNA polymerase III subunit gamma/tau [Vicinamibacterales bacterium]
MPYLALARKWRPQRFEDVIGQRGVVETLKNAIGSGRLAQSFIFAGPRGVGKTTTARILARALNCVTGPTPEPCGTCDACLEIADGRDMDVLEIDGATYTGVDAVREVIVEPLAIAPMRDRFKIFIIDEVHRLSKSAFDALLKSIEEPPPYVKFMMATTDLHSVPATIQSRSQVFELKTLPFGAIRDQLKTVTSREKVQIDDAAIALVARSAEGSMRDALSALDQILAFSSDRVTSADVSTVLGLIGRDLQFEIAETVAREDVAGAFRLAGVVVESGFDLRIVCRELARLMRDLMVVKIDPTRLSDPEIAGEDERDRLKGLAEHYSREDLIRAFDLIAKAETDIRASSQPRHLFEMALVKWIHLRKLTPLTELIGGLERGGSGQAQGKLRPSNLELRTSEGTPAGGSVKSAPDTQNLAASARGPRHAFSSGASGGAPRAQKKENGRDQISDIKTKLLSSVRDQNKSFYHMVIAQAKSVEAEGDSVVFTFAPVHKGLRAQLEGRRSWLEQLAHATSGRKIAIVAREGAAAAAPAAAEDPAVAHKSALRARAKADPGVQAVLDVFGGEIEDVEEIK